MNDFIKYNNMEIINDGDIFVKVEIKDECLNPFHIVHGGLIFALGDTAMGVKIKSLGKTEATIKNDLGKLVATMNGTYFYIK